MRTITKTLKLYQFDELSDSAKEKARDWFREAALDYDWWEFTYEDAKTIGLEITSFDLDRNRHATGILGVSVVECCSRIIANHGKSCETYIFAQRIFTERREGKAVDPEEFKRELLEEYSIILQKEYEYLLSDEAVDESIISNEYEFNENGERTVA